MTPFRNVHICFAVLIPAAALGFAPFLLRGVTLSGRPLTALVLVHTALMTLWVLMLIAQAWFIRTNRFQFHRWVGWSSYIVAPVIIASVLAAEHENLNHVLKHGVEDAFAEQARLEVFGIPQILAFAVAWGLAILYRKRTALHVRFIVSTAFAISTAIVFRVIFNWFTWLPGLDPDPPDGILAATWTVQTLLLFVLITMDWRMGLKRSPFWVVTALIGVMHIGYWSYGRTEEWLAFCKWFADLRFSGI
jgi:hypothetical protein